MATILDTICEHKRVEIAAREAARPRTALEDALPGASPVRPFAAALLQRARTGPALIAEVKRGSPSLGCIRPDLDAAAQARAYQTGGATALSVLTDERFFFGADADFSAARAAVRLPMLRKEFIIDPYQVLESRVLGADCILLIMSILSDAEARELAELTHALGMDVLAETHSAEEVERAVAHVPYDLIGVNNRNLNTFSTDEATARDLAAAIPDRSLLVAESGLHSSDAIRRNWRQDIRLFLIGEAFVRAADPAATVRDFAQALSMNPTTETPS